MAHRVIVAGMGKRGVHHATAFAQNPNFDLVGISSRNEQRLAAAAEKLGGVKASSDARTLAQELKPDVFCFCTLHPTCGCRWSRSVSKVEHS